MDMIEIINAGLERDASDIHFIPFDHRVKIYHRNKGILNFFADMDWMEYQMLLQKAKALSQMNISEKRLPQDGVLKVSGFHVRVSTLRSIQGESLVLRLFRKELMNLSELGISLDMQTRLMERITDRIGINLISGETGMGKSTTLYAIMMKLRDMNQKVLSIEDPVEREIEGVIQSQINEASGYGYERAIFASLRQDPDYICIGEIRSKATAEALVRAALTGHRVISTIHAHDFSGVMRRLTDFGIREEYVVQSLSMVMNQKLINSEGRRRLYGKMEFSEDQRGEPSRIQEKTAVQL